MTDHTTNDPNNQLTKVCSRCGEEKPATTEYFGIRKRRPDGLHIWCRKCEKAYQAEYREANRERVEATAKEWAEANKEKMAAYKKQWAAENAEHLKQQRHGRYEANKDEILAEQAKYRAENPEKVKASRRAEYQRNREKYVARAKAWSEANIEKVREYRKSRGERRSPAQLRLKSQKRRTAKANKPNTWTEQQWLHCLDYFSGCCAVCGRPLGGLFHTAHADHWIAISNPDSPGTVARNMICLCGGRDGCNESKSNKDPIEWLIEKFGKREGNKIAKRVQAYFDSLPEE